MAKIQKSEKTTGNQQPNSSKIYHQLEQQFSISIIDN